MRKTLRLVLAALMFVGVTASAQTPALKDGGGTDAPKRQTYNRTVSHYSGQPSDKLPVGKVMSRGATEENSIQYVVNSPKKLKPALKAEGAADVPQIFGNVVFSNNATPDGLYEIPSNSDMAFKLMFKGPWALGGAVLHDGVYYTHNLDEDGYVQDCVGYDFETGEVVYDTEIRRAAISVGMSDYNGTVYGIFSNSRNNGYRLGTCVYGDEGPEITEIATLPGRGWTAFAIDGNGQGWGIRAEYDEGDLYDAALYTIDLATGEISEVGPCEITSEYTTAMAFERRTNRLFWTVSYWGGSCLTEVDTKTGEAKVIYEFPGQEQVTGLYIPTLPGPDSPAAPADLAVDFPSGSLSGKITFTAPATLNGGDPATGNVKYSVSVNGKSVGSGTTTYGSKVSVDATVEASAFYDITAVLTNNIGAGPAANLHAYIGYGVAETPVVTLTREGDVMTVNWEKVSATVDGGYIDPAGITYDVTRYPDEVSVAKGLTANTYSDTLPVPEDGIFAYYYAVTARNNETVSAPGNSNEIVVGNGYKVPYSYDFDDPYNFRFYSVVDANRDLLTWQLLDKRLFMNIPREEPADDWVITPGIYLEAGKLYAFEFDGRNYTSSCPSRFEVLWGKGTKPADLTMVAMDPVVVTSGEYETLRGRMIPTESGYYNIGVHCIADEFNFYTYMDNFRVGYTDDVAAAPTELDVKYGANGALHADVVFKAPTKYISGKEISKIDKVVVKADDRVICTLENVVPGAQVNCSTDVDEAGTYTFSARAYTMGSEGLLEGDEVSMPMYIGIDYPKAPTGLAMTEPAEPGVVHLTWNPVTKDVREADITDVLYNVYKIEGNSIVPRGYQLTAPEQTYRMVDEGKQEFIQLGVAAVGSRGQGEISMISGFAGNPYVDYFESFANRTLSHNLVINTIKAFENNPRWVICDNTMVTGLTAADDDNGFVVMQAEYADEASALMLGKISLENLKDPVFSFYTFNIQGESGRDENIVDVYVRDFAAGTDYNKIYSKPLADTGAVEKWNKVVCDLSEYKDKTVEIMLGVTVKNMGLTMFDAFKVAGKVEKDLSVRLEAPQTAKPGEEFTLTAVVRNNGDADAGAYTVKIMDHGNVVFHTFEGESLICGDVNRIKVPYTFSGAAESPIGFSAEVLFAGDENLDNNVSDAVSVKPELSEYPEPLDLRGEVTPQGVRIAWNEPDLATIRAKEITDTFEDGEAGDSTYGNWTFVDKDNLPVGGVLDVDIPGLEAGTTKAAYLVFDSSLPQFNSDFFPHSGSKYLSSFFLYDQENAKDDWAISPMLSGSAQTVDFYARSFKAIYPESFETYYSTGSLNPDDFIKIEGCASDNVPEEWTLYTARIPEGAKYFAIRSNSKDQFMFFIDDVHYTAGIDFSGLTLEGYNVYRNNMKLNDTPVKEREYVDSEALPQDNIYTVTAVYKEGESKGSDRIQVFSSGIDRIAGELTIKTIPGHIIVEGAADNAVSVFAIDGLTIADSLRGDKLDIEVASGYYLVKVADKTVKVVVK